MFYSRYIITPQIPVAVRSKSWLCGRSLAGIAGSHPAGGMDMCNLLLLCVVRQKSLRLAAPSFRGILPNDACLDCDLDTSTMRRPTPTKTVEP